MADMSIESRALGSLRSTASESMNKAQRPEDQKVMDTVNQVQQRTAEKVEQQASDESVAEQVEQMNQSTAIRNTSLQFVFDEKGEKFDPDRTVYNKDYLLEILDRGKASLDEMKAKGQL